MRPEGENIFCYILTFDMVKCASHYWLGKEIFQIKQKSRISTGRDIEFGILIRTTQGVISIDSKQLLVKSKKKIRQFEANAFEYIPISICHWFF